MLDKAAAELQAAACPTSSEPCVRKSSQMVFAGVINLPRISGRLSVTLSSRRALIICDWLIRKSSLMLETRVKDSEVFSLQGAASFIG
jgi:hypothetical protein